MAPSAVEQLRDCFIDSGLDFDEADWDEVRKCVEEIRNNLRKVGKPPEYSAKHDWQHNIFDALYTVVPAVMDGFAFQEGMDDAMLATKFASIFSAVTTVNLSTSLGDAPTWKEVVKCYRNAEDNADEMPMDQDEWVVTQSNGLDGQSVPLDVIATARAAGRVLQDKGVVRFQGQDVFVGRKGTVSVPPPGPGGNGLLFGQLSHAAHGGQALGYPPTFGNPPGLRGAGQSPSSGQLVSGQQQMYSGQNGWGQFAGSTGVKPDHVPTAPHLLRLICPSGGGGPNCGRAWVTQYFSHLMGSAEYEQLTFNATLLDQRIGQMGGADAMTIQQDTTVEMLCSEIAAIDFLLKTGDVVGASEMRALVGSEQFASSLAARKAAYGATKDYVKNAEHAKAAGRGRATGFVPRGRLPGKGGGSGRGGGVQCHRCGELGHPARLCTAPEPKQQ
jgi:hypothetical protein